MGHQEPDTIATQPQYDPSLIRQLKEAMSSETMLEVLRRDWPYLKARRLTLRDCQVVRVYPRDRKEFLLEYEMRFLDENGERGERVFGELIGEEAEKRYGELLEGLKKTRKKQLSRTAPTDLITCLPDLGLILRFAGLDEELHGLTLIRKRFGIRPSLEQYLSLDGSDVRVRSIEILQHRWAKRCTVRWRFKSPIPNIGRGIHRSLIGKVYNFRKNRAGKVFAAMQALWEQGFSDEADDGIRIPKPLAYVPDSQLVLMEDAPGSSLDSLEGSRIEPAVEAAGKAIAKLHRTPLKVRGRHTVEDEEGLLRDNWVVVASQVHPGIKAAFEEGLSVVRDALNKSRNFEPTLVHRDFNDKHILVDGAQTILIDFDTLCLSDPAIDLGNFLAHLKLAGLQRLGNVERLEKAFLEAYRPGPSPNLPARIDAYTKSSLLRLACLYSLWPQWSHLAEPLLRNLHEPRGLPGRSRPRTSDRAPNQL